MAALENQDAMHSRSLLADSECTVCPCTPSHLTSPAYLHPTARREIASPPLLASTREAWSLRDRLAVCIRPLKERFKQLVASRRRPLTSSDAMASTSLYVLAFALCLSGGFQQGYIASVLNQPYDQIQSFINESWISHYKGQPSKNTLNLIWSLLNVTFPMAMIAGQFLAAYLCDRIGRKKTGLLATFLYLPATALSFFSKSLGNGINTVNATVWIVECAPARHRGAIAALQEFSMAIGSVVAQGVGVPFSTDALWPLVFVPNIFISMLAVFSYFFVYESPQFLLGKKQDKDKARHALAAYHGIDPDAEDIAVELRVCEEAIKRKNNRPAVPREFELAHSGITVMFNPFRARDPMSRIVRWGAWIGVMIAYVFTGARCLRSYSTYVLHGMSHWSKNAALYLSFGIGMARIPLTLVPVFLVDRLGRRPLIIGSTAISIAALATTMMGVLFGGNWKIATVIGLTALLLVNACGLGSVSRFYAAELVPRNLLLSAVSVLSTFEALTKIGVEFAWYPLANVISAWSFLVFLAPTVLFFVLMWRYCLETSKKSVNEVLNEMAASRHIDVSFSVQ